MFGRDSRRRGDFAMIRVGREFEDVSSLMVSEARWTKGVMPVEWLLCEVSGNGSENLTRFFGFVGVFLGRAWFEAPLLWAVLGSKFCLTGLDRAALIRLLRRTAIGLLSSMINDLCVHLVQGRIEWCKRL